MADSELLRQAKTALRVSTSAYDSQISGLLDAALLDLGVAGVEVPDDLDALVNVAAVTYTRMNFGSPADYDRLKASYDEQKAQLSMATGYTDWGRANA